MNLAPCAKIGILVWLKSKLIKSTGSAACCFPSNILMRKTGTCYMADGMAYAFYFTASSSFHVSPKNIRIPRK